MTGALRFWKDFAALVGLTALFVGTLALVLWLTGSWPVVIAVWLTVTAGIATWASWS